MNNPFQFGFPMMAPQPTFPTSPMLPQQQIIEVDGKASVDTIKLAPNSSLLAMDRTAPIVWMCVSDGVGKVTSTPYDITVHQEKPPVDGVEERLSKIEKTIEEMEKRINAKQSNVDSTKPKQEFAKHN